MGEKNGLYPIVTSAFKTDNILNYIMEYDQRKLIDFKLTGIRYTVQSSSLSTQLYSGLLILIFICHQLSIIRF